MDVSIVPSPASSRWFTAHPAIRLCAWTLGAAGGGLFLLSLVLIARRVGGGFQRPLQPQAFVTTALILASVSASLRLIWLGSASTRLSGWNDLVLVGLPTAASAIIGVSVMLPGSSAMALTAFWLILLAGEGLVWGSVVVRRRARNRHRAPAATSCPVNEASASQTDSRDAMETAAVLPRIGDDQYPPEHVSQQLVRSCDASGYDTVQARLRGALAPGQRALSLHVAFCPPLESTPQVELRQLDGAAAQIKVGQVLPYGVRVDVRLQHFSEDTEVVLIELLARVASTPTAQ